MFTDNNSDPEFKAVDPTQRLEESKDTVGNDRPTQLRIRIRIPKEYTQDPIISRLVSQHGLIVNVKAAILGANAQNDGWFDLELQGTNRQIDSAMIYLDELDVEIWSKSTDPEEENW